MSSDVVIDKIRKNSTNEVWVVAKKYRGKISCDVREYFRPENKAGWFPTKKGVPIPPEVVSQAVDAVEEMGKRNSVGEVVAFPLGEKAKICFGIREFQKHIYAEIRIYYREKLDSDQWKPGKGVTFKLEMLVRISEALGLAEDYFSQKQNKGVSD
jgi:hypothetical protein